MDASVWSRRIVLAILVYGVAFSILTSLRILALSAFAWDLGIFNQAMSATVVHGRFFSVFNFPGQPPQTLFGGHFSPILLLLLIPYSLYPSPFTLVVLQTWGIAIAALPLYLLGQRVLKSNSLAFVFALLFLLHPATQGVNWFDFHPDAFLLPTLAASLYFFETRAWRAFFVSVVLVLSTVEIASVLMALVAIGGLASEAWSIRVERREIDRRKVLVLVATLAVSIAWIYLAAVAVRAANPQASFSVVGFGYWDILGASGLWAVPQEALLHPDRALAALLYDGPLKAWYLLVLFLPLQFLSLRVPRAILCCLPWLGVSLLSNFQSFYLVGNQYPSFVLPFLFYGAIMGLARPVATSARTPRTVRWPTRKADARTNRAGYPQAMLSLTIVLLFVVSPLGPWALGSDDVGRFPAIGTHERAVLSLYAMIPPNASVLTQSNLFPLLSGRTNAYFVPLNVVFPPGTSFKNTMNVWTSSLDYILFDPQSSFLEAALLLSWANVSTHYSIVAASDGALLLGRGSHSLSSFQPMVRIVDSRGVFPVNAILVPDAEAQAGFALEHPNGTASHFWYGPFFLLPPGNYTVSYRLKIDREATGPLLALPIIFHPVQIRVQEIPFGSSGIQAVFTLIDLPQPSFVTIHTLDGTSASTPGGYFWSSTSFNVTTLGAYEFPGHAASETVQIAFDRVVVDQRVPFGSATVPVSWSSG